MDSLTFSLQALLARHEAEMADAERERLQLSMRIKQLELYNGTGNAAKVNENGMVFGQLQICRGKSDADATTELPDISLRASQQTRHVGVVTEEATNAQRYKEILEGELSELRTELLSCSEDAPRHTQRYVDAWCRDFDMKDQLERVDRQESNPIAKGIETEHQREIVKQLDRGVRMRLRDENCDPRVSGKLAILSFPNSSHGHQAMPAKLEMVWLSRDQASLLGTVVVANLGFHKSVACRFTLDHWKTVSEVSAVYYQQAQHWDIPTGHERFVFSINVSDICDPETKTLLFCVRYCVSCQEFWDNNNSINFQVSFTKKHPPQHIRDEL